MGLLSRFFKPCEHQWRYTGSGLRAALIPEWIFRCTRCTHKIWECQGVFPDKESFDHHKAQMGITFKPEWRYIVSRSSSFFSGVKIVTGGAE